MAARRLLPVFVALSIGVAACGRGAAPTTVAAGGDPAATSSTTAATTTSAALASTTTTTSLAGPASTTIVAGSADPVAGDPGESPVAGLDAAQLQAAVEAPVAGSLRSVAGATLDQVALADGTRLFRVRIPGDFTARSARVAVTVGSRVVGQGVLARDLGSLTAVTTDGTGLSAGQPVSYQWEGGPSIAAGRLAVAR